MRFAVVIPAYDNGRTIARVVTGAKRSGLEVLVVDDGSHDDTASEAARAGARVVRHEANRGKGIALQTGIRAAAALGATHVITLDGDGQHDPAEIPKVRAAAEDHAGAIVLGQRDLAAIPEKNRFGNRVSNFWVNRAMWGLAAHAYLGDTQCGFRCYPVQVLGEHRFRGSGFEFETEILIRQARAKKPIVGVPITVYYPPPAERVSHFEPRRDATRIVFLVMRFLFLPRAWW